MKYALFRGKPIDGSDWIYSYDVLRSHNWINGKWIDRCWLKDGYSCNQMPKISEFIEVDVSTVGQFARKHDMNGDEIYDGDRIKIPTGEILTVCWSDRYSSFCLDKCGWVHLHWFGETVESENCEVVGNIHVGDCVGQNGNSMIQDLLK